MEIPTKKPRKSKKHPTPHLSDAHKAANTALSQVRIFIEQAIGGMKRSNILVQVFRNRKVDFEDDAVGICAGLWNFDSKEIQNPISTCPRLSTPPGAQPQPRQRAAAGQRWTPPGTDRSGAG
jgi:DDE superfamily endonuclease